MIPGLGRSPGGGHGTLLLYSCLENPYGQKSLVGYSPRGHKESDTIESDSHTHTHSVWGTILGTRGAEMMPSIFSVR